MARSRKAKPPLTRTRIHTSMNELEIHLTERASDFPLLAQFFFKQPERPPDDQLLANLTEILNDVATSSLPLFANLAKRMLTDLCRLRSVGTLNNIIDHVGRKFRMEPGTLQSRCKTQRIALARQIAYYLCRTITGSSFPTIGEAFGRDHSSSIHGFNLMQLRCQHEAPFRLSIEKMERQLLASATTTIAVAA
jgi:Bacterial dnaA protein helix-turn-helix